MSAVAVPPGSASRLSRRSLGRTAVTGASSSYMSSGRLAAGSVAAAPLASRRSVSFAAGTAPGGVERLPSGVTVRRASASSLSSGSSSGSGSSVAERWAATERAARERGERLAPVTPGSVARSRGYTGSPVTPLSAASSVAPLALSSGLLAGSASYVGAALSSGAPLSASAASLTPLQRATTDLAALRAALADRGYRVVSLQAANVAGESSAVLQFVEAVGPDGVAVLIDTRALRPPLTVAEVDALVRRVEAPSAADPLGERLAAQLRRSGASFAARCDGTSCVYSLATDPAASASVYTSTSAAAGVTASGRSVLPVVAIEALFGDSAGATLARVAGVAERVSEAQDAVEEQVVDEALAAAQAACDAALEAYRAAGAAYDVAEQALEDALAFALQRRAVDRSVAQTRLSMSFRLQDELAASGGAVTAASARSAENVAARAGLESRLLGETAATASAIADAASRAITAAAASAASSRAVVEALGSAAAPVRSARATLAEVDDANARDLSVALV